MTLLSGGVLSRTVPNRRPPSASRWIRHQPHAITVRPSEVEDFGSRQADSPLAGRFRGSSTNEEPSAVIAGFRHEHSPGGFLMSGQALHLDIRSGGPSPPNTVIAARGARRAIPRHEPATGRHASRRLRPRAVAFGRARNPKAGRLREPPTRARAAVAPEPPHARRRHNLGGESSARATSTAWRSSWRSLAGSCE